ncbi:hypothetical protein P175DRAFT_0503185 [Aspergillus ochraceoroseus IBT 24754]|uniref:ADP-ribose 1''-phosphate phosphatase n=1 Tax=Aspergillus ochraceoroseus IBT 24754 TaxID=1392256 RepID=A0A2T5LTN1_9EURO|nr:uncharacterized protein P175DRAFT_0503185 [Aspergillus ochraceoroseus IBT 24754]PTU19646.1 hypothetical protein P175DRAFT_0503185 [Aspergillus ochraceoroseus IBT 24754]
MDQKFITAYNEALPKYWPLPSSTSPPPLNLTIQNTSLKSLPGSTKFDLIVSPANSYGRLDGAFDDAISRQFCLPHSHYDTLTHAVQKVLYDKYRGFAPPGTCTLVPFPAELRGKNDWGCKWVAICPTMRTPDSARWDREVVYECVWSLLCAVEGWNRGCAGAVGGKEEEEEEEEGDDGKIRSVLITPMATGCGGVTPQKWAAQFVLAMRHFVDAVERPERWSRLSWGDIYDDTDAINKTWKM